MREKRMRMRRLRLLVRSVWSSQRSYELMELFLCSRVEHEGVGGERRQVRWLVGM